MSITRAQQVEAVRAKRRREARLKILLPFIIGLVFISLLTIFAVFGTRSSVVADILLIVFMLCPWVLILFASFIGLVAAVYGMGRLNRMIEKPFRAAGDLTFTAREKVSSVSMVIAKQSIEFSSKTAPLEKWMDDAFTTDSKTSGDNS